MSTDIYLMCASHNPPICSDQIGDVRDLNKIRKNLNIKDAIVVFLNEMGNDITFEDPVDQYSCWFIYNHRNCELVIKDEYGKRYSHVGTNFDPIEEVASDGGATSTPEKSG